MYCKSLYVLRCIKLQCSIISYYNVHGYYIFQGLLAFLNVAATRDVFVLQAYTQVISNFFFVLSIGSLLVFRWRLAHSSTSFANDAKSFEQRALRVPLVIPLAYLAFTIPIQVVLPFMTAPQETG